MDIKVVAASHKEYRMPEDEIYLPLLVGAALGNCVSDKAADLYLRDDDGVNISDKNKTYCELTALYYAWKNLDADYLGLVHYRRHFEDPSAVKRKQKIKSAANAGKAEKAYARSETAGAGCDSSANAGLWDKILSGETLKELLSDGTELILPKKRNYLIETIYSHYAHSHHENDLYVTRAVLKRKYPDYLPAWDQLMKGRTAHMFNMCIMRRDLLDAYCSWLFDVLKEVEAELDMSSYTDFDKRVFGRISELLMDVWVSRNNIKYKELPVLHMEGENWLLKGGKFIRRKFIRENPV